MTTRKPAVKKVKTAAGKPPVKKPAALTKPAAKSANKPSAKPAHKKNAKKSKKENKKKVIRDSFTMPQSEYLKIAEIKAICLKSRMHVKKSEVLRAGLKALAKLNATQLKRALNDLEKIKTGRPKKH
jgi:vancomycin resistance protein YoaR